MQYHPFIPRIDFHLDAVAHNLASVLSHYPHGMGVMAVVKDDAYGCGAEVIAPFLEQHGVTFFAVATAAQAYELRRSGCNAPLLVLGECALEEIEWAATNNVRISVNDLHTLDKLKGLKTPLQVHCNIDTGMGRLGLLPEEIDPAIETLTEMPHIHCEGIYTHFPCADMPDSDGMDLQRQLFYSLLKRFHEAGFSPDWIHTSNSAAIMRSPEQTTENMVRPGIALYGCRPDPAVDFGYELHTVLTMHAPVVKVKTLPPDSAISYGSTYRTSQQTDIATIPIGYAHGLPRCLGNTGSVLIRGRRYTIAGRVTMDYIMVDCGPQTDIRPGDQTVVIGSQGEAHIGVDDIARQAGTIGYEILCGLGKEVTRSYYLRDECIYQFPPEETRFSKPGP
jgi:alanine racemase